jgi:serpin B
MRNLILLTGLLLFGLATGCSDTDKGTDPVGGANLDLTPAQGKVIGAADDFGLDVFQRVIAARPDENAFLSPLSISIALGMVVNGAEGQTREAILDALRLSDMDMEAVNATYGELMRKLPALDPNVTMEIANSTWYREGFPIKPTFLDVTDSVFSAEVTALDFNADTAADVINAWVAEKTRNKIQGIVQAPVNPLSMLFLINAVYFYGDWAIQFDSSETTPADFHLADGSTTECRMMYMAENLQYRTYEGTKVVRLPYGDGDFAMVALLPPEGIPINSFIADLTVDMWKQWLNGLSEMEIELFMPRFTYECEIGLNDILSDMGMGLAFRKDADLTGIAEVSDLHISAVKHKAFVDVNESGTEAAAATSIEVGVTSVGPTHPVVRLDRPFAFIIYERSSGTMVFAGKVAEPKT